jgi:hypothetical protein
MPTPIPTADELIATIKRSRLPTVLVEGSDDQTVYRHVESLIRTSHASVLPCGGRDTLLAIFRRRIELAGRQVAFVADRDMWLFSGIPTGFEEIIWTEGYSIENDIYSGSDIERLLEPSESAEHKILIDRLCKWFSFEVEEYLAGRSISLKHHVSEIVPLGQNDLDAGFIARRGYREPKAALHFEIASNYQIRLRGKQLIQALVRYLSASGRIAKYSFAAVIELCVKTRNHSRVERLLADIDAALTSS